MYIGTTPARNNSVCVSERSRIVYIVLSRVRTLENAKRKIVDRLVSTSVFDLALWVFAAGLSYPQTGHVQDRTAGFTTQIGAVYSSRTYV